jgi:F-box and WD-40 domain protein 1/11
VYCLEFDGARILTGSRDRTIRAWCARSGAPRGVFRAHAGSVFCLKFERDWDAAEPGKPGTLVSGSSDCAVLVWEIRAGSDGMVSAQVKAVLRGHAGGVLDIRMDERSIVSWCVPPYVRAPARADAPAAAPRTGSSACGTAARSRSAACSRGTRAP